MIYLDTSSLLKVLLPEPESAAANAAVLAETEVAISPLTELELLVQFRGMWLGGELRTSHHQRLRARLQMMKQDSPFVFPQIPGVAFATALKQHEASDEIHCRAYDRLHLAAMEELGINRLMTNDERQADAAKALGFAVVIPGAS